MTSTAAADVPYGWVVTPDRRASDAGQAVLDAGGSAADAVIAASAVLCVVYPQNVTLGGDAWTLTDDGGEPTAINGTGRAPFALSADVLSDLGHTRMPGDGPHSITVPGLVGTWGTLHHSRGRIPWPELIRPARDLAAQGTPIASAPARDLHQHADALRADPGCAATFFTSAGAVLREGDPLVLPALADTLDRIAEGGPEVLYGGDVGQRYVEGLRAAGSLITVADLAGHRTESAAPIRTEFAGHEVLTTPPSSQGFTLLKILRLMAWLGLDDPSDAGQVTRILHAVALAGQERDRISADPDQVEVGIDALLSPELVAAQAADIEAGRPSTPKPAAPAPPLGGDTIGIVAVDATGSWVSSVQSVAGTFGSRVLEPATGILAHNRGSGFSLDPRQPGLLVGGRRPPHTLMPCLVRRADRTVGALATMGGRNQPFVLAQVLCRVLAGDHPQDAVAAPRWVVQQPGPDDQLVLVDERLDTPARAALAAATTVDAVDPLDNRLGHCQAVWSVDDGLRCGSDPRADGSETHSR